MCLIPLFTTRFFVLSAFYKPKNVLLRSQFFGKKNVRQSCKMLSASIGGKIRATSQVPTTFNPQPATFLTLPRLKQKLFLFFRQTIITRFTDFIQNLINLLLSFIFRCRFWLGIRFIFMHFFKRSRFSSSN
jgi:hypothetical protein